MASRGGKHQRVADVPWLAEHLRYPESDGRLFAWSQAKVEWVCHEHAQPFYHSTRVITKRQHGWSCHGCLGKAVVPGENDLWTTHPELSRELANPEDARRISHGSREKVAWRCLVNPEHDNWLSRPSNRDRRGCPSCAAYGPNLTAPTILYAYACEEASTGRPVVKIGVTTNGARKRQTPGISVREVLARRDFPTGYAAQEVEGLLRKVIRSTGHNIQGRGTWEAIYTDTTEGRALASALLGVIGVEHLVTTSHELTKNLG